MRRNQFHRDISSSIGIGDIGLL